MRKLAFLLLFLPAVVFPQKRIIVSRLGDAMPLPQGKSALSYIQEATQRAVSTSCGTQTFGYTPSKFSTDGAQYGLHKDIMAMWFEAPSSGTIDTIFWLQNTTCSSDSTLNVRVLNSNIYTNHGPGWNGYPAPQGAPEVTCWGYYINTNDIENGIAAFPEDASGPWVSTVDSFRNSSAVAFPPTGLSIWGLQGFPVKAQPNKINYVAMSDLSDLTVNQGDPFFITFKIARSDDNGCTSTNNTSWDYHNESDTLGTHDWKYYEHNVPGTIPCKGWVARGSWNLLFWYVMTPSSNTPPVVQSVEPIHNTTSTDPQPLSAVIFDCDAAVSSRAGVSNAFVRYKTALDSVWSTVPMSGVLDQFSATLPGASPFTTIEYRIVAADSTGATDSSATYTYKVVDLNSAGWYRCDTLEPPTSASIAATGTLIDTSAWFIPPRSGITGSVAHRGDDGTAGPFPIAGGFPFYGDTMYYAWVSVDGAMALSKTATDTIDVNSNGFATDGFDFPFTQHHNRADTLRESDMPKAFIAPFWADWVVKQDSPLATFGHIRTFDDTAKFVVEWDSLGTFTDAGAQPDIPVFRVVLNKNDYTIEFQYDEIGINGLDTVNLVGMQCDSNYHPVPVGANPPYNYFNKDRYPEETHIHNGLDIRYVPAPVSVTVADGWNLLSLPTTYLNNSKGFVYPTAISSAFIYNAGYVPTGSLYVGAGYWVKFNGAQAIDNVGRAVEHADEAILAGWNIVGAIGGPVATSAVTADAGTGITPSTVYFGYNGSYNLASTLVPGYGYWVRASGAGQIHLTASSAPQSIARLAELSEFSKITVGDKSTSGQTLYIGASTLDADRYQMPPRGPEGSFDARFASGRMVETYPAALDGTVKYAYPIAISSNAYPVTISWSASKSDEHHTLSLRSEDGKLLAVMQASGRVTLTDAKIRRVEVTVSEGVAVPKVFALSRNFPNPFNPTTRFTVEMPQNAQVDVSVYDVLGRKIATLLNGEQPAGYHTLEWDSHDTQGMSVPSGLYFIRMNVPAEQFSSVQKAMLVK